MNTLTTNGIKITVYTFYQPEGSRPDKEKYLFSYRVIIENFSGLEVQLLTREWVITDSLGEERIVKGEGVVGEQPIIEPDGEHIYLSYCPLNSPIGRMKGKYIMKRTVDGSLFEAIIPPFQLVADHIKN